MTEDICNDEPVIYTDLQMLHVLLQENTVVQTCVVACYSLASSGGFGCYLLSMDRQTFVNLGDIGGNRPEVMICIQ